VSISRTHSVRRLLLAEKYFDELPDHHKAMLPSFRDNLKRLRICIYHNYEIIKLIIADVDHLFENTVLERDQVSILFYNLCDNFVVIMHLLCKISLIFVT